jgi:hypothetical protein
VLPPTGGGGGESSLNMYERRDDKLGYHDPMSGGGQMLTVSTVGSGTGKAKERRRRSCDGDRERPSHPLSHLLAASAFSRMLGRFFKHELILSIVMFVCWCRSLRRRTLLGWESL